MQKISRARLVEEIQHRQLAQDEAVAERMLAYLNKRRLLLPRRRGVSRELGAVYSEDDLAVVRMVARLRKKRVPWAAVDEQVRALRQDDLPVGLPALVLDSLVLHWLNTPPESKPGARYRAQALWGDSKGTLDWPADEWKRASRYLSPDARWLAKRSYAISGVLEPDAVNAKEYFRGVDAQFHREYVGLLGQLLAPAPAGKVPAESSLVSLPDIDDGFMKGTQATFAEFIRRRLGEIAWEMASAEERRELENHWPSALGRRFYRCQECGRFRLRHTAHARRYCDKKCANRQLNRRRRTPARNLSSRGQQRRHRLEANELRAFTVGRMADLGVDEGDLQLFIDVFAPDRSRYGRKPFTRDGHLVGRGWPLVCRPSGLPKGKPVHVRLPKNDVLRHLLHQSIIVAADPAWEDNGRRWTNKIVLDLDASSVDDEDHPLDRLARLSVVLGRPDLVFLSSESLGVHAYWFIEQAPVDHARAGVLARLREYGYQERNGHIEVFPAKNRKVLRLPLGLGGCLLDWDGDWAPMADENWRQLGIVLELLRDIGEGSLPTLEERFGQLKDAPLRDTPPDVEPRENPATQSVVAPPHDGLDAASWYFDHGIPGPGLRNEICCRRMFTFFLRTSGSLEEAINRGGDWLLVKGKQSRMVAADSPYRVRNYMEQGIRRRWTWRKILGNQMGSQATRQRLFPDEAVVGRVASLAAGIRARPDTQGRILVWMATLLCNLAIRECVRPPGGSGGRSATLSSNYLLSLPGATNNNRRPTYYPRLLGLLVEDGLVSRGSGYRTGSEPPPRSCIDEPPPQPEGKSLIGTFTTTPTRPDFSACIRSVVGDARWKAMNVHQAVAVLGLGTVREPSQNVEGTYG